MVDEINVGAIDGRNGQRSRSGPCLSARHNRGGAPLLQVNQGSTARIGWLGGRRSFFESVKFVKFVKFVGNNLGVEPICQRAESEICAL
jgi:hypothetical protein